MYNFYYLLIYLLTVVMQNEENRVDVGEGQTLRLRLQRSVYTSGSVTVSWTTHTHQAGARDYSPHRGSVTFASAQQTDEIILSIADDEQDENLEVSNESIMMSLSVSTCHDCSRCIQVDCLSGKSVNVGDFDSCHGNIRKLIKMSGKILIFFRNTD